MERVGSWGQRWVSLRSVGAAAVDLVLPSRCATCDEPGGPLCARCRVGVRAACVAGGPQPAGPDPPAAGMPSCWSTARLDGPLRSAVTAYKDHERRDLAAVLAPLLAEALVTTMAADPALRRARAAGERVLVVPMPTSRSARRRRGDDPVGHLARHAVRIAVGGEGRRAGRLLLVAPAVRHGRAVADQSSLGREERARNLRGSLVLDPRWRAVVARAPCVLLDDVVTTGASLTEAARVLWAAGADPVAAATVAATPRRYPTVVVPGRHGGSVGVAPSQADVPLVWHRLPG